MIVIVAGSVAGVLLIGVLLGIYFVQCRKKTAASAGQNKYFVSSTMFHIGIRGTY